MVNFVGSRTGSPSVMQVSAAGGGGTWFQSPMAYYRSGKTFFGYIDGFGDPYAAQWDHATRTVDAARLYTPSSPFEIDDHDNPAFVRRASDGRLVAGWTTHVWNPYSNISTNPDDATVWDGATNLGSQMGGTIVHNVSGYTYAHLNQLTGEVGDPIYYTARYHDAMSTAHVSMSVSTDDGETFGTADLIVVGTYHKTALNGDARIDFIVSDHPFYGPTSIYHMYYEGGDFFESDGTQIVASQPFALSDMTLVYDGTTNRAWMWDIAIDGDGFPVVAYVVYETPFPSGDWHYEIASWDGASWSTFEVSEAGTSFYEPPETEDYAGGIALDKNDPLGRAWVSKNTDGAFNIYELLTADGWDTVTERQLTFATDPDDKHIRPASVVGHNGDLAVIWWFGRYDTYIDYSLETWGAST